MMTRKRQQWTSWLGKGVLAVADQGLISGSNFACNLLLARWLEPEEYGVYAISFSVLMFIMGVHQAVLIEPMTVLGSLRYRHASQPYLGTMLQAHLMMSVAISGLLFLAALVLHRWPGASWSGVLTDLGISAPSILLLGLLRSAGYVELKPQIALQGAALYAVLLLGALALIHLETHLTPALAFKLMGLVALLTSLFMLARLKPQFRNREARLQLRPIWIEHWRYGRWALGTNIANWAWENSWYLLSAAFLGLREVGGLRATGNLLMPLAHVVAACGRLAQPYVARRCDEQSRESTARASQLIGVALAAGAAVYCLIVTLFGTSLLAWLYKGQFTEFAPLFPWIGLNFILTTLSLYGVGIGLRALESPDAIFRAQCVAAVVAIGAGIPGGYWFGIGGILGASIFANCINLALNAWYLRQRTRELAALCSVGG